MQSAGAENKAQVSSSTGEIQVCIAVSHTALHTEKGKEPAFKQHLET